VGQVPKPGKSQKGRSQAKRRGTTKPRWREAAKVCCHEPVKVQQNNEKREGTSQARRRTQKI
jgi:hypothetical protein